MATWKKKNGRHTHANDVYSEIEKEKIREKKELKNKNRR